MDTIPSNFSRYNKNRIEFNSVNLTGKRKWICSTKVPFSKNVNEIFDNIITELSGSDLLFDGCSFENKEYLKLHGFKSITFGNEAIIDLSNDVFKKRSLKELVKRGNRHGKFEEIFYSEDANKELQDFIKISSHGREPQLKNLFATSFQPYHRLFILKKDDKWICALMLSYKSLKIMQTEMILRSANAPVGVMEALFYKVIKLLKKEQFEFWSLGAVPFIDKSSGIFTLSWFINTIGRKIKFAYNYKGLFNFKNKFNPIWQPYYLCYNHWLSPMQIFSISKKSNLIKLIIYNVLLKLHLHYGN